MTIRPATTLLLAAIVLAPCLAQSPSQTPPSQPDPGWTGLGDRLSHRQFQYAPNTRIHDSRLDTSFASNVGHLGQGFAFLTRFDQNLPTDPAGPQQANLVASYFTGAPGSYAYGAETVTHNLLLTTVFATKGLSQVLSSTAKKLATGDFGAQYFYNFCMGGSINGDDEGCEGYANVMSEGLGDYDGSHPDGTIPSALIQAVGAAGSGQSSLQLKMAGVHPWNNGIGAGRFAVLTRTAGGKDASLGAYTVTGHQDSPGVDHFGTYTVGEAVPVSAVWGRADTFQVPNNNDVPQPIHTTVAIDPLSPQAGSGYRPGIACMWTFRRNERVRITEVAAPVAGRQAITVLIRQDPDGGGSHPTGPFFFQDAPSGGLCQTVGRLSAYDQGPGMPSQNIPLMGAVLLHPGDTVSHSIVYDFNWTQGNIGPVFGLDQAMPIVQHVTLKRTRATAVITQTDGDPNTLNQIPGSAVANASDPSFNAANVTLALSPQGIGYPSPGPDADGITATVTAGAGRNLLRVYSAAEIIGVTDPDAASTDLGSYVALESNSIPWPIQGTVDFPAHHSVFLQMSNEWLRSITPGQANGKVFRYDGPSINRSFIALQLFNSNPPSMYTGSGGFLTGPAAVQILGPHRTLFDLNFFNTAPLLPGANLFSIGCVVGGCQLPSAVFNLENVLTRGAPFVRQVDQFNQTAVLGFQGREHLLIAAGKGLTINAGLSLEGHSVQDLADPVQPTDAVNLESMKSAISGAIKGFSGSLNLSPTCSVTVTNGLITGKTGC